MHEVRMMESYVEVSWLNGVLLLYLSALFASYVSAIKRSASSFLCGYNIYAECQLVARW